MGMPLYRCPDSLPSQLGDHLATRNDFDAATFEPLPGTDDATLFTILIRRNGAEARVFVGCDSGGIHAFITGGSFHLCHWKESNRLFADAQAALLALGARMMTSEEIENLDKLTDDSP